MLPAHTDPDDAWRVLRAELRRRIGASTFDIWLAGLQLADWDGQVVVLPGPPETELWVSRRYGRLLGQAAEDVLGPGTGLRFAGGEHALEPSAGPVLGDDRFSELRAGFNPRYRFEQFIIGETNRLAHAGALAVAENPGQAYNPLFIYAPPGLGKTHLLHAIGSYVMQYGAGASVRYTTAEAFTNHFLTALSSRSIERSSRPIAPPTCCSSTTCSSWPQGPDRGGVLPHVQRAVRQRPSTGAHVRPVAARAHRDRAAAARALRGRAGRRHRAARPRHPGRDPAQARRAGRDRGRRPSRARADRRPRARQHPRCSRARSSASSRSTRSPTARSTRRSPPRCSTSCIPARPTGGRRRRGRAVSVESIQATVAARFGLSVAQLTSARRTATINWARQVAMSLVRDLTDESLPAIGRAFGGRNHATVHTPCNASPTAWPPTPRLWRSCANCAHKSSASTTTAALDRLHPQLRTGLALLAPAAGRSASCPHPFSAL